MRIGRGAAVLLALFGMSGPAAAAFVEVSFVNNSEITDSNVAAAIGAQNGNFDSGVGRVGIESGLDFSLSDGSDTCFRAGRDPGSESRLRYHLKPPESQGSGSSVVLEPARAIDCVACPGRWCVRGSIA